MASSRPSFPTANTASLPITRSMSRKSLALGALDGHEQQQGSSTGSSSRPSSSIPPALPRSRTSSSLNSSTSTLSRSRTTSSFARPGLPSKSATTQPTSTRPRRVLVSSNSTSTLSSNFPTTEVKSPPKRGRLSRAEAGQMTGMGVVRVGPPVPGRSPSKNSLSSSASTSALGAAADPFSTAFVRPAFDFEVSAVRGGQEDRQERVVKPLPSVQAVEGRRRRQLGALSEMREDVDGEADERMVDGQEERRRAPTTGAPFDLTSPRKRTVSAPARSPSRAHLAVPNNENVAMDVDASGAAFLLQPSSPVRGAISPRTLTGRTAAGTTTGTVRRKLDEVDSSSEDEDELDFLSPRKKAKRPALSAPSPVAASSATALPLVAPLPAPRQQPGLLRSPPPKKKLPSSASVRAQVQAGPAPPAMLSSRPQPASAAMQRSSGRTFPLPNLSAAPIPSIPSKLPRSQPLSSLSASTSAPPPRAAEASNRILPASLTGPNLSASTTTSLSRSTRSSLSLSTSSRPSAIPAPSGASRLPRAATRVVAAVPAPFSEDATMSDSAPAAADVSTLSTASTSTVTSSKSEETARRLANLQSMLSRLQMPASRRTSAEGVPPPAAQPSTTAREYEVPIAPPAEAGSSSDAGLARRKSLPRRVSSAPTPPVAAPAPAAGARRRSSIAARAAGGIVSTAKARGDVSFAGDASSISIASSSAPTFPTRRRSSVLPASSSFSGNTSLSLDSSLIAESAAAVAGGSGGTRSAALQGVVAFVDVRTAEGDDSGMIFVDMLKGLGARVTVRPSSLTTHIIYKSGRPSTLQFYRTLPASSRPSLVGIAWVVRCAETGQRVDEAPFRVEDVEGEKENRLTKAAGERTGEKREVGAMAQAALGLSSGPDGKGMGPNKRRRSMEPKALAALNQSANASMADNALKASIAASIERARRKSLAFAPKVGSPLAKRVFVLPDEAPQEDDE
ncbi:hypothetical protein JCM8097_001566 [Rhodosporidiobolus ruineniae]